MSEIKIHRSLHHSGVVGFEHFFEDAENVYIILELCQSQSLNELLRRRKRLQSKKEAKNPKKLNPVIFTPNFFTISSLNVKFIICFTNLFR